MNKLLTLIILLTFSCNFSNSDQINPLNMSNNEKIVKYQANEPQTDIQSFYEIWALKDEATTTSTAQTTNDTVTSNITISYPPYYTKTILKIEKNVNGNIILNEVIKENSKIKKLLEIKNEDISRLKDTIQYGGGFKAKDIRDLSNFQNITKNNNTTDTYIKISEFKEYLHLQLPSIITNDTSNPPSWYKYFSESYIIKAEDLLKIITGL
ncbi:hypothetical protein [Borreliella carolinensis]|uniref:hypothetical protein n=1 Tax=Borreliella carolinensis TaxID=478174 RepID=UPI0029426ECB|nr:hypothetical protein [Borreliella carolinensis]WNY65413.1 hypothetical protein QIA46_04395 [Borreliella carolinensis]